MHKDMYVHIYVYILYMCIYNMYYIGHAFPYSLPDSCGELRVLEEDGLILRPSRGLSGLGFLDVF